MADLNFFEQIEAYVNETMPEAERTEFEQALKQDPALQKEYRAYQAALVASDILGLQALEEMSNEQAPRVILLSIGWKAAAAILVLAVCGILVFANLNYRNDQLFSAALSTTSVDFSDAPNQKVQNAWRAFQQNDFNTTLQILSPDRNDGGFTDDQALLLYAITLIKEGNVPEAIPLLTGMSEDRPEARWYLALALLQNNQTQEARNILETLAADTSNPYTESANQLLQKTNSFWFRLAWQFPSK